MQQLPPISPLLCNLFLVARVKYQNEHTMWTNLSGVLSGRFSMMPAIMSIQRHGDLDLLLRCIEDEFEANIAAELADNPSNDATFHYQVMLSETWVIGFYEIFRAFRQRDREQQDREQKVQKGKEQELDTDYVSNLASFKSIIADLELLRMPLAKYEIAKDKNIKQPLPMRPVPASNGQEQHYLYDKNDPSRYHIMPSSPSPRGSMMWLALDHKEQREYWIERRELADRILALKDEIIPAGVLEASRAAIKS